MASCMRKRLLLVVLLAPMASRMRKHLLLVVLLAAAAIATGAALVFFLPLDACPAGDSSAGPSPSPSAGPGPNGYDDPGFCLPRNVVRAIYFVFGVLIATACISIYDCFAAAADDDEEQEASGTAKKARYVAICADPESGPGGKN